ncbi:aldo/keto reductase [Pseudomonas gingeri]|uniref:Aldo/keto reductase n=2 Tax=Pseudomonas gingeri TaxID=117681 RepID=A0A7Y8C1X9_9PSED|nr:aldo/keto reductase [Pseudomonas gingeri]NWB95701.1 aldo/keto reductase [Pseudomonas gingeri]
MIGLTRRKVLLTGAAIGLLGRSVLASEIKHEVKLPDGLGVPSLGQGTFQLAEGRRPPSQEEDALRTGIALGLTLIDTAEMYGDGSAEEMVGRVITGQRNKVFLVSKVLPNHHTAEQIRTSCAESLKRLQTGYIDLYLLHWRTFQTDLKTVVETFEDLRAAGKIRRWGVSSFSVKDMEELYSIPGGRNCATNQVRYNLQDRAVESDLIPWSQKHQMPIMAFSPLGKGGLLGNPVLKQIAERHQCSTAAIALAWTLRDGGVISIPGTGSAEHVRENARALDMRLSQSDLDDLDRAFPA